MMYRMIIYIESNFPVTFDARDKAVQNSEALPFMTNLSLYIDTA